MKFPENGIVGTETIDSLSDLVESQRNFYANYHYRILNHTLLQLLLLFPAWVFDFLNTLVFIALPLCVLRINGQNKDYWLKYAGLLFFIWIFHFNLGRSYFLTTGSLNYSWLLIPQLLYLSELFRWQKGEGKATLLIGLAILNFNANENVLVVLFGLTLLSVLFHIKQKQKAHGQGLWPLLLAGVVLLGGGLLMLASPSLDVRLEEQGFRNAGIASHLIEYTKRTLFYLLRYIPVILLAVVLRVELRELKSKKSLLLVVALVCSLLVMIAVPLFEARSAVFGFFVALMLVVALGQEKAISIWLVVGLLFMSLFVAITRYPAFQQAKIRYEHNEQLLSGRQDKVQLEPYCDKTRRSYLLCHRLSSDPQFIDNRSLAAVYGKEAVSLKVHSLETINSLAEFQMVGGLFYERKKNGTLDILVKNREAEKHFIVRGSKRTGISPVFLNLLPASLRIYGLDYLEDITAANQKQIVINNEAYYHLYFRNMHSYEYVLLAEYDIQQHSRVGEIFRLELK